MGKISAGLAVIVALAIAALVVDTARGATADCSGDSTWNAIAFNAEYGFRPYLLGIGMSWWQGKERLAAPAVANESQGLCGDAARKVNADQQRFYVLLRAFPQNPTRAQWKARFRPLMQTAIAADADFLTVVGGPIRAPVVMDKAWLVKNQSAPFGSTVE